MRLSPKCRLNTAPPATKRIEGAKEAIMKWHDAVVALSLAEHDHAAHAVAGAKNAQPEPKMQGGMMHGL